MSAYSSSDTPSCTPARFSGFSGFPVFLVFIVSGRGAARSGGALRRGDDDRRVVGPLIAAVVAVAPGGKKDLGRAAGANPRSGDPTAR